MHKALIVVQYPVVLRMVAHGGGVSQWNLHYIAMVEISYVSQCSFLVARPGHSSTPNPNAYVSD